MISSPGEAQPVQVWADGPIVTYSHEGGDALAAELNGELVLDNGCLRIMSEGTGEMWAVVLPNASWEGDGAMRVDGHSFSVGDRISLGGGYHEPGDLAAKFPEVECLSDDYFLAGIVEPPR